MDITQHAVVKQYRPLIELVPSAWHNGTIETEDGATISYTRTGGAKPPLLLLHGVQASSLTWLRTALALQAEYDVIMPNARGHGDSSKLQGPISVDVLVHDITTLLRTLELEQPYVVGHSTGADIAGRLAVAQQARALVLVDPALHNVGAAMNIDIDNPPPWMEAIYHTMRALRSQSHAERMVTGLGLLPPGTTFFAEADYVSLIDAMAQFDLEFYRSAIAMGYLFEADELLRRITCPTLLLTARPMMQNSNVAARVSRLQRVIPTLQHFHFPDSGHFIMYDQFDRFVEVLTTFLHKH